MDLHFRHNFQPLFKMDMLDAGGYSSSLEKKQVAKEKKETTDKKVNKPKEAVKKTQTQQKKTEQLYNGLTKKDINPAQKEAIYNNASSAAKKAEETYSSRLSQIDKFTDAKLQALDNIKQTWVQNEYNKLSAKLNVKNITPELKAGLTAQANAVVDKKINEAKQKVRTQKADKMIAADKPRLESYSKKNAAATDLSKNKDAQIAYNKDMKIQQDKKDKAENAKMTLANQKATNTSKKVLEKGQSQSKESLSKWQSKVNSLTQSINVKQGLYDELNAKANAETDYLARQQIEKRLQILKTDLDGRNSQLKVAKNNVAYAEKKITFRDTLLKS